MMVYNFSLHHNGDFMNKKQYESLSTYWRLAKATIRTHAPKNIMKLLISSDEVISYVAYEMMLADNLWDGVTGTREGYRSQRGRWAIGITIKKFNRKKDTEGKEVSIYRTADSLDKHASHESTIADIIPDNDFMHDPEKREEFEQVFDLVLKENDVCTTQQRKYIQYYYLDKMNFAEIGRKENISRERVRQVVNKGISKIREALNVE